MKKWFGLLVLLVIVLAGCTNPENAEQDSESEGDTSSETAAEGGTLTIADLSEAESLDPHVVTDAASMRYIENMYNTLFRYVPGEYGEIEGDLVADYELSEDETTYTMTLHEGVTFHNGDALTSEDVKYSIERIIEKDVRANQFSEVESIETPSETEVVITLSEPVAPFLTFLAYPMNTVVNKTVVEENGGELDNADAGSGPFKLDSWTKDQEMVLVKNEDYFKEGKPHLNEVVWRSIPDATARSTAIRNGELDILLQAQPQDVDLLDQAEGVNVESVPGTYWEYMGMNVEAEPLQDEKVRQAIAWALDRGAINEVVKFGEASPLLSGNIPQNHWAHLEEDVYPEPDQEKAQQLLEEAGYGDGLELSMKVSTNQSQIDAAQVIKQQLEEVGIMLDVVSQEDSVFFEALGSGDFETTVVGWVGFVDPDEFLYNIFHTEGMYNQQNYSNAEVDQLLEQGRKEMDQEKRAEIYAEAQKLIAEDAPMAFLYANPQISGVRDRVQDFVVDPTVTTISLEDTKVE